MADPDPMQTQLSRQQPRVHYRKPVRLSALNGEATLEAMGGNLSEGGLYVDAKRPLAVGSTVRCKLEVEGRQVVVAGTIAWTQDTDTEEPGEPEPPQNGRRRNDTKTLVRLGDALGDAASSERESGGMGIRFDEMGEDTQNALKTLVRNGEPVTTPVELRFPGLDEPVRARAQAIPRGLAVSATLPFLELGSRVGFRLQGEKSDHRGHIADVLVDADPVDPAVPRLTVELALADRPSVPPRVDPPAEPSAPPQADAAPLQEAPAPTGPRLALTNTDAGAASPLARVPAARRHAALIAAAALGAVAGILMGYTLAIRAPLAPITALLGASTGVPTLGASTGAPSGQPAQTSTPTSSPPAGAPTQDEAAPDAVPAPAPPPDEANTPTAAAATPKQGATGSAAPRVSRLADGATVLFIPMDGNATDMQVYELTSPGVAVTLPNAKPLLPLGMYGIHEGVARRVWIKQHGGENQVRVIYRRKNVHPQINFAHGGLRITLR